MKAVTITTDGACQPNPGRGGWAAILRFGSAIREIAGSDPRTTNNRMELRAIIEGVRALKEPCAVTLRTDSRTCLSWCAANSFQTAKSRAKNPLVWPMVEEFRAISA